ncbi:MAG: hypothetical protein RLZZ301_891 [Bacteroidota bacterium]|jgi:crotonobetainyl-CoA:carnitine CoA-transferase CaiB-like acyl-CoA transferase
MHTRPFNNLKVIDLSSVLAGPSVGTFFAELGARVLKFEHPVFGDVTNHWRLPSEQTPQFKSAYYASVNYGKEIRTLDLSTEHDYQHLLEELADTDILLCNFKREDYAKFRLQEKELWNLFPKLIIGKISGFGDHSDRVAYDLILQAETGFMSMNGSPESGPLKMPVALIDVLAAHQLKEGLLVALLQRDQLKCGQLVSVSLYDAAISSLANQAANYLMAGSIPARIGSLHPNIAPYGELFKTHDHRTVTFAIGSETHFQKLCGQLGCSELAIDPRFCTNQQRIKHRKELSHLLQKQVEKTTAIPLLTQLEAAHVPAAEVKDLHAVFQSPEAQAAILEERWGEQLTKRVRQIAFQHDAHPQSEN